MVEIRNIYNILVGKIEGKRPCGRTRNRWLRQYYNGSYGNCVGICGLNASDLR
jgi:hypothetical protein